MKRTISRNGGNNCNDGFDAFHRFAYDLHARFILKSSRHESGEYFAVNGERSSRRDRAFICAAQHE